MACGAFAIAIAPPAQSEPPAIDFGGALVFSLPVASMADRRFATVIRQQTDFSCGSAALATLLHYGYGDQLQDERSVFQGMWDKGDRTAIRRAGFSLLDMKRYLAGRGIASDGYRVTLDQIAAARVPGIALIVTNGYHHFVVVKGIDASGLIIGDPSLGLRRMTRTQFMKQWNGVYFVLNGPVLGRKAVFATAQDQDLAPAAPLYTETGGLSLAGLNLVRPAQGSL